MTIIQYHVVSKTASNWPYTPRIKGQKLNFYLETHSTSKNICFIHLRNLARSSKKVKFSNFPTSLAYQRVVENFVFIVSIAKQCIRTLCRYLGIPTTKLSPKWITSCFYYSTDDFFPTFKISWLRGRTHVRIKGHNLNFYLETHTTPHNIHEKPHNIYFIRLRILPRILGTLYWRVDDP